MSSVLTPVDQALQQLLQHSSILAKPQTLPLRAALGRVLAQSQTANMDVPAYDNSAMDGYAVQCSELQTSDCVLPLSQTIAAGHPGRALQPGSVARIFTGAAIPDGADAVVMQENTAVTEQGVRFGEVPQPGQNIRLRGHDIQTGTTVLNAGHLLQPHDLGLLASLGIGELPVYQPLTVAIINTGDEVIEPGTALGPGQLYDSNSFTLEGLLTRLGMKVLRLGIVEDSLAATEAVLRKAAMQADCIISTGGVSVGDEDHVRQAVTNQGELTMWKLAIKPGKPFSYGKVMDVPFFGLPGNPVAVFVTFVCLVRPCLLRMQGASVYQTPTLPVRLGFAISESGTRQEYLRVKCMPGADGLPELQAFADQGSSIMTSLSWADGLAVIPPHTSLSAGSNVMFMPFSGLY